MTRRKITAAIKANALHFRLWRLAKEVDWDCSAQDLARAANVSATTVYRHARKGSWPLQTERRAEIRVNFNDRQPVDGLMASTNMQRME